MDAASIVAILTALGVGGLLAKIVDKWLAGRRDQFDVAKLTVEITTGVMSQARDEIRDLRAGYAEAKGQLIEAGKKIDDLRAKVDELTKRVQTLRERLGESRADA
jgi:chromosome segregation ATPase